MAVEPRSDRAERSEQALHSDPTLRDDRRNDRADRSARSGRAAPADRPASDAIDAIDATDSIDAIDAIDSIDPIDSRTPSAPVAGAPAADAPVGHPRATGNGGADLADGGAAARGPVTGQAYPPLPALGTVPRHVAIIMDGNGRWAERRGKRRQHGHRAGAEAVRAVVERLGQYGVDVVTLFAFSTENWNRPRVEVQAIMRLASRVIDRDLDALDRVGARLVHVGDLDPLPGALRDRVERAIERTAGNDRITVALAFNYGGRADIVRAVQALVRAGTPAEAIDEAALAAQLSTAALAEPDLLIRTGGERRISNFLVWQAAYAELYFTPTLWPDFGVADVDAALAEYAQRLRRFGGVGAAERSPTAADDGATGR